MATRLTKVIADFQTSLAAILAVGATSGTLLSATDDDLVALPAGNYFFTIDPEYPTSKEHIVCTLSGTAITSIKSVSRQGVQVSGVARVHRVGATVILTDWAILNEITNLLNGATALDGSNPLIYDTDPTITDLKHLATKKYIDNLALSGAPVGTIATLGISKLSVAAADPTNPIVVGDNDPRVPTQNENDALAGTGTPNAGNPYVTANDPALTNNIKTSGNQTVGGVKTFSSLPQLGADPSGSNDAVRKGYIDSLMAVTTGSITLGGYTFYYTKIGKIYTNLRILIGSYMLPMWNDATTIAKICTGLGKTLVSSDGFAYYNGQYPDIAQWNGSGWNENSGTSWIAYIIVA